MAIEITEDMVLHDGDLDPSVAALLKRADALSESQIDPADIYLRDGIPSEAEEALARANARLEATLAKDRDHSDKQYGEKDLSAIENGDAALLAQITEELVRGDILPCNVAPRILAMIKN